MDEITVKLRIPEEVLKQVDLDRVVERIEREIMLEYNLKKLRKVQGKNLEKLLEEVEEEWSV